MAKTPDFDLAAAHRYFAARCFNQAWDLIEKPERSAAEDRLLVALNQASLYHWLQRPDCRDENLSVGYWQASRIQALLGNAGEARRHAEVCLAYSRALAPFYQGYAHEALARAAFVAGDRAELAAQLVRAAALAERIESAEERELLVKDLDGLRG